MKYDSKIHYIILVLWLIVIFHWILFKGECIIDLFEKKMNQWIKNEEKRIIFFVKRGIHTLFLELEPDWDNS